MPRIIETLEQEEMWYGQDGRPYRVTEMETSHVVNVLAFLRRRADDLARHAAWYEVSHAPLSRQLEIIDRWRGELGDDPVAWLERRPLVKALRYELVLRDTVEGEVIGEVKELT